MNKKKIFLGFLACFVIFALIMPTVVQITKAEENEQTKTAISPLFKIRTEKATEEKNSKLEFVINYLKEKMSEERLFFPLLSILKTHPVIQLASYAHSTCCFTVSNPKCLTTAPRCFGQ